MLKQMYFVYNVLQLFIPNKYFVFIWINNVVLLNIHNYGYQIFTYKLNAIELILHRFGVSWFLCTCRVSVHIFRRQRVRFNVPILHFMCRYIPTKLGVWQHPTSFYGHINDSQYTSNTIKKNWTKYLKKNQAEANKPNVNKKIKHFHFLKLR